MSPDLDLPARDLADGSAAGRDAFFGRRWALGLGTALLVGMALITLARWREGASAGGRGPETVIQQPVPAEPFPSRSDTTAPDPGDTPP